MSARTLRKLRQEREAEQKISSSLDHIDEDSEDDENDNNTRQNVSLFANMMSDDSSSSGSESEEDSTSDTCENGEDQGLPVSDDAEKFGTDTVSKSAKTHDSSAGPKEQQILGGATVTDKEEEENLDSLLAEFETKDQEDELDKKPSASDDKTSFFSVIVQGMDHRDLDIDHVLRTNLLGESDEGQATESSFATRRSRSMSFVFGQPPNEWVKPPHYVGGGIGMTESESNSSSLPWPYSSFNTEAMPPHLKNETNDTEELLASVQSPQWKDMNARWYSFTSSDTYQKNIQDYERIQASGDANMLALFVADHPYNVKALLQLSSLSYMTGHSQEGLALIKRSLWIFECAALRSFAPHDARKPGCFLDHTRDENQTFFAALFRMIKISSMAGCVRTSLAISRYMLALDPLRDSMNILVIMDYFALSTLKRDHDQFIVDLVGSQKIKIYCKDDDGNEYVGELDDMPNWAFSCGLALFRLSQDAVELRDDAIQAMTTAVQKFPSLVERILVKNEVNLQSRSLRTDWPSVLPKLRNMALVPSNQEGYDPILYHATRAATELISTVFINRGAQLWSDSTVQRFLHDACQEVISKKSEESPPLPSPALLRYSTLDPSDFDDSQQRLPEEANPMDPGILPLAMEVNPNRPRLLGRHRQLFQQQEQENDGLLGNNNNGRGFVLGGPPTRIIDPDSPMMQVFLEALLPWAQVDGIQPPAPR